MDIIQLPAVPAVAPLHAVLAIMFTSRRLAVVTQGQRDVLLVSSTDVRLGINRDRRLIMDLDALEPMPFLPVPVGSGLQTLPFVSSLGEPHRRVDMSLFGPINFAEILSRGDSDYAVIGQIPGIAFVLTRHETRAELYADPPLRCACGNPRHVHDTGESDNVSTGEPCRKCSGTITCG